MNAESLTIRPHLSSLTSDVDRGSDGTDQRFLADGEITGDGKGTNMITTSQRIDLWHYRDQLRTEPSTMPTMAATTALLHYAGDVRPVKLKWMAQEVPAAHPERVGAKSRAG